MVTSFATTGVASRPALLASVTMSSYAVWVAYKRYSVMETITTLPCALVAAWAVCRADRGMPPTLRGVVAATTGKECRARGPRFQLVAHPINHFGEKLRWMLDLAGAPYEEANVGAIILSVFRGRSVPWLVDRHASTIIGNSDEAVAYVGAVCAPLDPLFRRTRETMAWEPKLNMLGHAMQGFGYSCALDPAASNIFSLVAWGAHDPTVPVLDRLLVRMLYPILNRGMRRIFKIDSPSIRTSYQRTIDAVLDEADAVLEKAPFLAGSTLTYVDITFASLLAPLMFTSITFSTPRSKYANGRFVSFSNVFRDHPDAVVPKDIFQFERNLLVRPSGRHVQRLYDEHRHHKPMR